MLSVRIPLVSIVDHLHSVREAEACEVRGRRLLLLRGRGGEGVQHSGVQHAPCQIHHRELAARSECGVQAKHRDGRQRGLQQPAQVKRSLLMAANAT